MEARLSEANAECPFCVVPSVHPLLVRPHAIARLDAFPVSRGHCLIVPRRHVASFFDCTPDERNDMMALLAEAKDLLEHQYRPDGYNVGLNNGAAAGQTVMHVHMHLIPRYQGDVPDPRGGVRWVIPEKAAYWAGK